MFSGIVGWHEKNFAIDYSQFWHGDEKRLPDSGLCTV